MFSSANCMFALIELKHGICNLHSQMKLMYPITIMQFLIFLSVDIAQIQEWYVVTLNTC